MSAIEHRRLLVVISTALVASCANGTRESPVDYAAAPAASTERTSPLSTADREIERRIADSLGSTTIDVDVDNGIVTLTGVVPTTDDWREAESVAMRSGARSVYNYLLVTDETRLAR